MQIILYGIGLIAVILIPRLFFVKKLPKQVGLKDILDEMLNESYDDEDSEKFEKNDTE